MSEEAKWYVVHTYSGYENKVKEDLEKSIENLGMQDIVLEVKYPTEEAIEILPSGKKKTTLRKVFPGYVMVKMLVDVVEKPRDDGGMSVEWVMNPRAWYVVRNTRGVTGFVGPGSEPIPLTDEEYERMISCQGTITIDLQPGDSVRLKTGNVENQIATVERIIAEEHKVEVSVEMFAKKILMTYDIDEVERL